MTISLAIVIALISLSNITSESLTSPMFLLQDTTTKETQTVDKSCAVLLFGLPRAFKSLVLPSLSKNVLEPTSRHNCDYFVHYYNLTKEGVSRAGTGGTIDPHEVLLLENEVHKLTPSSHVQFEFTEEADFWSQYQSLLEKIDTTNDPEGRPLYFPWGDASYHKPDSTNNIVKMWHSIESVFNMMESYALKNGKDYSNVAIIRSDVFFATPVDLFEYLNRIVVPNFAGYPIPDRSVVGPLSTVKIWATERFKRLDEHVTYMYKHDRGYGMHSERFIHYALIPAMQKSLEYTNSSLDDVLEHPSMCFFRARADETLWANDCGIPSIGKDYVKLQRLVEEVLNRRCHGYVNPPPTRVQTKVLSCPLAS